MSRLIAIIDDDEAMQDSLRDLMEAAGLVARCFGSAEEFLESDLSRSAACLIVDIRMPKMSGLELQTRLKEDECNIPIIFITAHGDAGMRIRAMREGAVIPRLHRAQTLHSSMALEDSDRALIVETLEHVSWVVGGPRGAAAKLGLKRTTLLAKMRRLGISRQSLKAPAFPESRKKISRLESGTASRTWNKVTGQASLIAWE